MEKSRIQKTSGITLVALVVTIVILIILATIGINVLSGEKGLIKKSQEAKNIAEQSKYDEEVRISNVESKIDKQLAIGKVKELTLEQKIGQMLLVNHNNGGISKNNNYGGILFFEDDFKNKTSEEEVRTMINGFTNTVNIPYLIAVDEEGATGYRNEEKTSRNGVIRVSSNDNLTASNDYLKKCKEKYGYAWFQNPKVLYNNGGFDLIRTDTIEKSKFLYNLGINLNLAPVADWSEENAYIYYRTVGLDAEGTSKYIETVINASKEAQKDGFSVSYCLKHFPGYGNGEDTHDGNGEIVNVDSEIYLRPFKAGIAKNAESILISHLVYANIEPDGMEGPPGSLSPKIHSLLRDDLKFEGVIITDALDMGATKDIPNKFTKAVLAGNDILIVVSPDEAIKEIKNAVENGEIKEEMIDEAVTRIITWKYSKGMFNN